MNGVHDMGGMDGFGKVEPEPNEPPFHAPWEGRVLAMQRAMGYAGAWQHRHVALRAGEAAAARLSRSVVLQALGAGDASRTLLERGFVDADEIERRPCAAAPASRCKRKLTHRRESRAALTRGMFCRPAAGARAFQGRRPRADQEHPSGRRTPACRAMRAARSAWSSATTAATCIRTRSRSTRATIRNGSTRWCSTAASCGAPDADPTLKISIDAFEPYLEPA